MRVHEIFTSISGEISATPQGTPMKFIRLAGCNLGCSYCDTPETQKYNSENDRVDDPFEMGNDIAHDPIDNVMITGGEPLLQQKEIVKMISSCRLSEQLRKMPHKFHVETNGTIFPSPYLNKECSFIFDYKLDYPGRMVMAPEDYYHLKNKCFIKFVVGKREDLENVELMIQKVKYAGEFHKDPKITFAIGSHDQKKISNKNIVDYIIRKQLVRTILNVQIHKIIGMA